jgi:hypothetical protein
MASTHGIADCIRFAIPQSNEWENIGNEINAAMVIARADFVNVHYGEDCLGRRSVFTDQMIERTNKTTKYGLRT